MDVMKQQDASLEIEADSKEEAMKKVLELNAFSEIYPYDEAAEYSVMINGSTFDTLTDNLEFKKVK